MLSLFRWRTSYSPSHCSGTALVLVTPENVRRSVECHMATHLKRRIAANVTEEMDRKVRATVEGILADVKKRGDAAVREHSEKFDKWVPRKLNKQEIDAILAKVSRSTLEDIKFAQAQIRNFAQHQRAA